MLHRLAIAWNTLHTLDVVMHYDDAVAFTSRSDGPRDGWHPRNPPELLRGVASMSAVATSEGRSITIAERLDGTACVVELGRFSGETSTRCFSVEPPIDRGSILTLGDDGARAFFAATSGNATRIYAIRPQSERATSSLEVGEGRPIAVQSGHAGAVFLLAGATTRWVSIDFESFDGLRQHPGELSTGRLTPPGTIASAVPTGDVFAVSIDHAAYFLSRHGSPGSGLRLADMTRPESTWTHQFGPAGLLRREGAAGWLVAFADIPLRRASMLREAHVIPAHADKVASEPQRSTGWTVWSEPSPTSTLLRAMPSSCL